MGLTGKPKIAEEARKLPGLGERIKAAAKLVGGIESLARETKIPRRTLGNYLSGRNEPKASALVEIIETTGVSPAWLLLGERPMRATGEEGAATHAAIDAAFLKRLIIALEEALIETGRKLPPADKARAIVLGYEIYREKGRVDRGDVEKIIALAA